MALLCLNSLSPLASFRSSCPSTSSSSSSLPVTINVAHRLHIKCNGFTSKYLGGVHLKLVVANKRDTIIIRAASDVDSAAPADDGEPPSESKREVVPVEKLPLESKLQQLQEQLLRMKLAKKIRLRRKRLVRKRKLRKIGKWPPSKVKKMKNV